jgi:hypothetical protein
LPSSASANQDKRALAARLLVPIATASPITRRWRKAAQNIRAELYPASPA